jgi:hypothetical protein
MQSTSAWRSDSIVSPSIGSWIHAAGGSASTLRSRAMRASAAIRSASTAAYDAPRPVLVSWSTATRARTAAGPPPARSSGVKASRRLTRSSCCVR